MGLVAPVIGPVAFAAGGLAHHAAMRQLTETAPSIQGQLVLWNEHDSASSIYYQSQEKLQNIQVRCCRLIHGSAQWMTRLINPLQLPFQVNQPDHWWITVKTDTAYFILQIWKSSSGGHISIRKCSTSRECDLQGLRCAGRDSETDVWTRGSSQAIGTVNELIKWASERNPYYHFLNNNCQRLSMDAYSRFTI